MHRRTLLVSAAMGSIAPVSAALSANGARHITLGDMEFGWRHDADRLHGDLSAPGTGWLAVGFNDARRLDGTRFVIAAVADAPPRAEVHIALPPDHKTVESLTGASSGLGDLAGRFEAGRSILSFSLPHRTADRYSRDLSPGHSTHLMLAWSHAPDFDHHSAWRRHIDVVL